MKIVANKLGGAHFDLVHQKPSDKALDAIRKFEVMNRKAAMHEILSYGQQLARSESARELLAAIQKRADERPEPMSAPRTVMDDH